MLYYLEYLVGYKKGGKRMKKKYGILVLVFIVVLILSVCGGKEELEVVN